MSHKAEKPPVNPSKPDRPDLHKANSNPQATDIRGVLLDLSGVLYIGEHLLAGADKALVRLHKAGLPVRYITNTTRSPRQALVARLRALGLRIDADEVFTAPLAARHYVSTRGLTPWLLVHPAIVGELGPAGVSPRSPDDCDCVLVGDAGEGFGYAALNQAFRLLIEGRPLLAMGRNRYFREQGGLSLDAGPFVAALEYASGVEAEVIGKPACSFFEGARATLDCAPAQVVMVGDDVDTDVCGAIRAGMQGILVGTGKYRSGDESGLPPGARFERDICAAVDWIVSRV